MDDRIEVYHRLPRVAYFCMEYGLSPRLPLYAGGLGILAGDLIKSAHDLQLPLTAVGILWREGYSEQHLDHEGRPYDTAVTWNPHERLNGHLTEAGQCEVQVRGETVPLKIWRVSGFGNAPLYLLDADVPGSPHNWITRQLYAGGSYDRIAQEIVLGVGGVRALRALGIEVDVYHFNEGHAVFAGLELIRELREAGSGFEEAWRAARERIIFTTHTPVAAGNETHSHDLLFQLGAPLGLSYDEMVRIGGDPFNMTVAGLRLSRLANAVSKLHGMTARKMWEDVEGAAPITSVTNGAHPGTWQDPRVREAFYRGDGLWEAHQAAKEELLRFVRERTGAELSLDVLTVGFARRAVPYKRPDLLFRRLDVIGPLLESGRLQLLYAGKSHPHDAVGHEIVQRLVEMGKRFPNAVAFLPNYDMEIGRRLTRGCDIWLNHPQRPLEASGTSGMKAAMNGVLNMSVLDGWWPEGCHHGVNGWQAGGGYEGPDQESHDLASLYQVLFHHALPTYYEDRLRWVEMMRAAIARASWQFSSHRTLLEYWHLMYFGADPVRTGAKERAQATATV